MTAAPAPRGAAPSTPPSSSGPALRGEPVFFGPDGARLFGWYVHPPAGVPLRGRAVLLSNPFGNEARWLHATYRALAAELASRGLPVLRFDHAGTGDSEGDDLLPGRVPAWLNGIARAAEALRAWSGAADLALVGVRLGATLALEAAARLGGVEAIVAWAPYRTGGEFVREHRAFRMLKGLAPPAQGDGAEEAAGYVLTGETCRALARLDASAPARAPARRALLLARDDLAAEPRLAQGLAGAGVEVTAEVGAGYTGMMRDAWDGVVPHATLARIAAFLEVGAPPSRPVRAPLPEVRAASLHGGCVEEAVRLGPEGRLFGVVTLPPADHPATGRPAVILLNTGSNSHVGPHRLYVPLARRLAADGFTTLRLDLSGIGDSLVRPGGRENDLYAAEAPEDVRHGMAYLTTRAGVERFALFGICSGGYAAFHTAAADPRVVSQVIVNLQTFAWRPGDSLVPQERQGRNSREYRRRLRDLRTWLRLARGGVNVRWVLDVLARRGRERLAREGRALLGLLRSGRLEHSDVARGFHALRDRGVDSLLVYSSDDLGLDVVEQHLGRDAGKLRGKPRFRLAVVEGADHTFSTTGCQPVLLHLVAEHLRAAFPAGSSP
jgi:alpha-beta hydrolase superfamily lysophospholipase